MQREIQHGGERGGKGERYNEIEGVRDSERGEGDSRTERQTDRCTNDIRYAILFDYN